MGVGGKTPIGIGLVFVSELRNLRCHLSHLSVTYKEYRPVYIWEYIIVAIGIQFTILVSSVVLTAN